MMSGNAASLMVCGEVVQQIQGIGELTSQENILIIIFLKIIIMMIIIY